MAEEEPSFEEAFTKLEETVRALEKGGLPLEQALALYEEGMRLTQWCNARLDAVELRVTQLQTALSEGWQSLAQEEDPFAQGPASPP